MAGDFEAPGSMGSCERRCLQLLGCIIGAVGFGLRYPLKMLPLLLLQLFYKLVWLTAVALPMWSTLRSTDLTHAMVIGVVVDLIGIPWPYVLTDYVRERGDRWRYAGQGSNVQRASAQDRRPTAW